MYIVVINNMTQRQTLISDTYLYNIYYVISEECVKRYTNALEKHSKCNDNI